jgi:hypothetical protein
MAGWGKSDLPGAVFMCAGQGSWPKVAFYRSRAFFTSPTAFWTRPSFFSSMPFA